MEKSQIGEIGQKRRSLVVSGNALLCRRLINKEMLVLAELGEREKLKSSDQKMIPRKESEERSSLWKRGRKVSDL